MQTRKCVVAAAKLLRLEHLEWMRRDQWGLQSANSGIHILEVVVRGSFIYIYIYIYNIYTEHIIIEE